MPHINTMDRGNMSIEQEKQKIFQSLDPQIELALRDGKTHRIEISMFDDASLDRKTSRIEMEIKHSKLSYIKTFDTGDSF